MLAFLAASGFCFDYHKPLTFEDRVKAQEAIERVYYNHRIWPKENPGPKPPFEQMISRTQIEAKVEDYLKKSVALDQYWQRPLTGEQLQSEMDRMAKGTKDPPTLRELFAALSDDPYLIAECLARPVLADRKAARYFAEDERFQEVIKQKAIRTMNEHNSGRRMEYDDMEHQIIRYLISKNDSNSGAPTVHRRDRKSCITIFLEATSYQKRKQWALKQGKEMILQEDAASYFIEKPLDFSAESFRMEQISFPKIEFDEWWGIVGNQIALEAAKPIAPGATMLLPQIQSPASFSPGTWIDSSLDDELDGRWEHTAIWTGSEMIVWGGWCGAPVNSGYRYLPSADTWTNMSRTETTPTIRFRHSAVWTGQEMIVWGGRRDNWSGGFLNTGARYNPLTDSWISISTVNCPSKRDSHTAVWTGSKMIIWGGNAVGVESNTGGRYDPIEDSWQATSVGTNCPSPREQHSAVWTGDEMVIWGGCYYDNDYVYLQTGGRYDPSTDLWRTTSLQGYCPIRRSAHTAVWTGSEMIIWGGRSDVPPYYPYSGGRYIPSADLWLPMIPLISGKRASHTAIWTGSQMIIWGGSYDSTPLNSGLRYDPATDSWSTASHGANCPSPRTMHTAVWTGSAMIVWGGFTSGPANTGGRYDPISDSWTPCSTRTGNLEGRGWHAAVWTGVEMIVWGGAWYNNISSGGRYYPATDSWSSTSSGAGKPLARYNHTAVWTGLEMIIWGGELSSGEVTNTGSRYNPMTNSWIGMNVWDENTPSNRDHHTAVWTGTEMIIWGGSTDIVANELNSGGRYSPSTDSWVPTSAGSGVPAARSNHTAIWTGHAMIIWGGSDLNTGSLYDPTSDTWNLLPMGAYVPEGRGYHTAVWTGREMIVWGGYSYALGQYLNSGGRYNPQTQSWLNTDMGAGCPSPRVQHTAVWDGAGMIVWGGFFNDGIMHYLDTGSRYTPCDNSWLETPKGSFCPSERCTHTAIWDGEKMIVWGGSGGLFTGGILDKPQDSSPSVMGASTGCADTGVLLTTQDYATYQWYFNNSIIPGATLSSFLASQTGYYSVSVLDANLCPLASPFRYIPIFSNPNPTITGNAVNTCPVEDILLITEANMADYHWYRNGSIIVGATSTDYHATQSGDYSVSYADSNGCSGTSATKTVTIVPCIVQVQYDSGFSPVSSLAQLCGDGDGNVEPGEDWQIAVRLQNVGNSPATNTRANLMTNVGSTIEATIRGNPASYGTIAANGGTAIATYQFLVSSGAACGNEVVFDIANIQSTEGMYPSSVPAFGVQVGVMGTHEENATQETTPLSASNSLASSNLNPAFNASQAVEAAISYNTGYTQKPPGNAVIFGPDDFANDANWTSTGGAIITQAKCASSNPIPSDAYYLINQNCNIKLTNAVSTVGYTTIRVSFTASVQTAGATLYLDWSPDGVTWNNGIWSTSSTTWQCGQTVTLPSGAEGKAGFRIRFRDTGSTTTQRSKVDYVKIFGTAAASGSWTSNARISLVDPSNTVTVLKAYGAADANPYDVKAYYTGPGTYQIRLEENLGGTATLTAGTMTVQKTVIQCDVSSCIGTTAPPPVQATGANAARFTKNPDGNTLKVTYDAVTCSTSKAILLYGTIGSWSAYAGCADSDLGNTGQDNSVNATGLDNIWFNIVWTQGSTAGHPGYGFNGTSNVARTWAVGTLCGMAVDDHSHAACP